MTQNQLQLDLVLEVIQLSYTLFGITPYVAKKDGTMQVGGGFGAQSNKDEEKPAGTGFGFTANKKADGKPAGGSGFGFSTVKKNDAPSIDGGGSVLSPCYSIIISNIKMKMKKRSLLRKVLGLLVITRPHYNYPFRFIFSFVAKKDAPAKPAGGFGGFSAGGKKDGATASMPSLSLPSSTADGEASSTTNSELSSAAATTPAAAGKVSFGMKSALTKTTDTAASALTTKEGDDSATTTSGLPVKALPTAEYR